jgi:hypothetical protein
MNKRLIFGSLIIFTMCTVGTAESGTGGGSGWGAAGGDTKSVTIGIGKPADFTVVGVSIDSDEKDMALGFEEINKAIELLVQKCKESGNLRLVRGAVDGAEGGVKYGFASGILSGSQQSVRTEISILVPLNKEHDNVLTASAVAARVVEAARPAGKVKCELHNVHLGVDHPEIFRVALLKQIGEEIARVREAVSLKGRVEVRGLEGPVKVRETDDRTVELYLNYSLVFDATN